MFDTFFYHGTIRKLVVAFADLFNNVQVQDSDSNISKVPIYFTSQSKLMYRYRTPDKGKKRITLPVMGFIITGQEFDSERQKNKLHKLKQAVANTGTTQFANMYEPASYDFTFQLSLWSKYLTEFFQIMEQITVNFKPHMNTSIKLLNDDDMVKTKDIPVILNTISYDTEFQFGEEQERGLKATMDFTLEAELYPNITTPSGGLIEDITLNMNNIDNDELIRKILLD